MGLSLGLYLKLSWDAGWACLKQVSKVTEFREEGLELRSHSKIGRGWGGLERERERREGTEAGHFGQCLGLIATPSARPG